MKKWLLVSLVLFLVVCFSTAIIVLGLLYPLKYRAEIMTVAKQYNLAPELVAAVINTESSFDASKVSAKGAIGLMQVLPTTAEYIANEQVDLFNPQTNIAIGTKYLAYLITKFNDIETALFAYNAGEGNVARWLTEAGSNKLEKCPYEETNVYVGKVKHALKFYRSRLK